jgi:hypothetical protein
MILYFLSVEYENECRIHKTLAFNAASKIEYSNPQYTMHSCKPRIRPVLEHLLLGLLRSHPRGIGIDLAYRLTDQSYRFPEDWYAPMPDGEAYNKLKNLKLDWKQIPREELVALVKTELRWRIQLRQAHRDFKDRGWLDENAAHGTWKLSTAGLTEAQHPNRELNDIEQAILLPVDLHHAEVEEERLFSAQEAKDVFRLIRLRRGQPKFRLLLIKAYEGRCTLTNCDALEALEAAHIVPVSQDGPDNPTNGILLRADVHTLFDLNLLGLRPSDRSVVLAPSLASTACYSGLQGRPLRLPIITGAEPAHSALQSRWAEFRRVTLMDGA